MKALILSGGSGSRLRPLTYTNAKQLLPLANKPILFYVIEKIVKLGISEIGIIVGDTHEEVMATVGKGDRWNVNIEYIHQAKPIGLGHAVKIASNFIGRDDFIMILGDNIFSMDLDALQMNYYVNKANTTILLHKVKDPSRYGVAVVDNHHVIKLVEKPAKFLSDLIITGIYIFDNSIFQAIDNTAPSTRGELEITDAIQNQIYSGGKVAFETITGWWKDTGKLDDMLEANRLIMDDADGGNKLIECDNSVCTGKIWLGSNVTICNSKIIGPVAIGDNAVITDSYIGPYTSIGALSEISNCELDNCILLKQVKMEGVQKRISGSLIGNNATIKASKTHPLSCNFLVGDNSNISI